MKHSWQSRLWTIPLAACLLAAGAAAQDQPHAQPQKRTYPAIAVDVPFQFNVGHRTFKAGTYQFILVGSGLLALRDSRKHIVATIITRPMQSAAVPTATKLVFTNDDKGNSRLTSILLENNAQGLEILGEEVAMRQNPPASSLPPSLIPIDLFPLRGKMPVSAPRR